MHPIQSLPPHVTREAASTVEKIPVTDAEKLKKSCREFEAIFLQSMFKAMRKTVPDSGFFKRDTAHEVYQDMLDSELSLEMSRRQSIGLAEQMYRQMEKFLPVSEKK